MVIDYEDSNTWLKIYIYYYSNTNDTSMCNIYL